MKRKGAMVIAIFLVAIMVPSVFAGGGRTEASGAKQKLTFMNWDDSSNSPEPLREYVRQFNAANNFNVEVVFDDTQAGLTKTKLPTLMASGSEPDLFHAWIGDYLRPYYEAGKLLSLTQAFNSDRAFKDQFNESALGAVTYADGNIYGFPCVMWADVAFYNKRIFDQLNLKIPDTYDELLAACAVIKNSGLGIVPIAEGNRDAWPLANTCSTIIDRLGGQIVPDIMAGRREWTDPVFVQAANRLKEMIPYFPDGYNALLTSDADNLFITGRAAVIMNGSWTADTILGPDSQLSSEDVVVKSLPLFPEGRGDPKSFTGHYSPALVISRSTKNADAAIAFGKGYFTREWQQKIMDLGQISSLKSSLFDLSRMPPLRRTIFDLMSQATNMQLYYDVMFGDVVGVEYNNVIQGILGGNDPAAAFARFNQFYKDNYVVAK